MKINLVNSCDIKKYDGLIVPMDDSNLSVKDIELPVEYLLGAKKLKAEDGESCLFTLQAGGKYIETSLLVLGEKHIESYRKLLKLFGDAFRTLKNKKSKSIAFLIENGSISASETLVKAAIEAVIMADYVFDTLKTEKKETDEISVDVVVGNSDKYSSFKTEALVLAHANLYARELVNLPANLLYPESLAEKVTDLGKEKGFDTEVFGFEKIKELGMEAYLSVSSASAREPKFIIMRYNGDPDNKEILGYVGKGLTFDSGGLSIKSTKGMLGMKGDMGGAAAVIGAIGAVAEMKLRVNVVAVVAACENMISGSGYRPGDIIGSMGGKSIFIGNTDAEGRLTLLDAMYYIVNKEGVNRVLDIATLTGAALRCTGTEASVVIGNDDDFFNQANNSFEKCGERIWRMPVYDEYKELIKHEEADLTNLADDPGTITAGLLIGEFNNDIPWLHVDIAGTFWADKQKGILSKGGTGAAVRPLYYLAKQLSK
ncbi:MAG: leucyl aminopeptidase [Clostridiales bacterium]|nr:leucyl aminopeptidase [Clostridiales bacterium]